ncbi:MAG: hypothetical protein WBC91_13505 [Phototrophicaceae bacterium]
MNKRKRMLEIGLREILLQAQAFDHLVFTKPRTVTRQMSHFVRYPKQINDIGRTVDARRESDHSFSFEVRQKRYLGRGTYAISARAKGFINYNDTHDKTQIVGFVQLGGQYMTLLTIMTLVVLLSFALAFITILFLPLALLMSAVITLHWAYLFADQRDLQEQLIHLVDTIDQETNLATSQAISIDDTSAAVVSSLMLDEAPPQSLTAQ